MSTFTTKHRPPKVSVHRVTYDHPRCYRINHRPEMDAVCWCVAARCASCRTLSDPSAPHEKRCPRELRWSCATPLPAERNSDDDALACSPGNEYIRLCTARLHTCNVQRGPSVKTPPPNFCPYLRQILTDFWRNSFAITVCEEFATKWLLSTPLHLNCVTTLLGETINARQLATIRKKHSFR